eukprot:CAMPEP_0184550672 /NCGR_PEP_ID=MMETSP0199_2-20130426/21414_1 /TAXON_ID=1112570 /ORGANISM="Thraustochytrium sp., Strain LLF1b" /LENGTH=76 /DNA_ID=CAMNT_0026945619 /DNA_START=541 /DNA_END=768 /DNA_ORIENTATION=-
MKSITVRVVQCTGVIILRERPNSSSPDPGAHYHFRPFLSTEAYLPQDGRLYAPRQPSPGPQTQSRSQSQSATAVAS